jgi:hypothetical protein
MSFSIRVYRHRSDICSIDKWNVHGGKRKSSGIVRKRGCKTPSSPAAACPSHLDEDLGSSRSGRGEGGRWEMHAAVWPTESPPSPPSPQIKATVGKSHYRFSSRAPDRTARSLGLLGAEPRILIACLSVLVFQCLFREIRFDIGSRPAVYGGKTRRVPCQIVAALYIVVYNWCTQLWKA